MHTKPSPGAVASVCHRFLDRPLALLPSRAPVLFETLQSAELSFSIEPAAATDKSYGVVGGVAVVPVRGVLVHERTWFWGETAYRSIAASLIAAMGDAEVRAVALHVNSPGGEVAGCFDLCDVVYGLRGVKPIWAILDEEAYSAAYAIASAADKIVVPRTGGSGSIGVIAMHVDITKALDEMGVKVTTIQYGAHKSDRYSTTPLSDEAQERMQSDIDIMGEMFVDLVARNRDLSPDKVRKTEAGLFLGASGLEQGLVDAVMAPDDAFLSLLKSIN